MPTKKTLITKLSQDVSGCNAPQLAALKAFMAASFEDTQFSVDFEVVEENEEDVLAKFLRSIRAEFKENDAPSIRIESQGEILQFPVNDAPTEGSDGRPRD